jgi:hypothetical protein
VRIRILGTLLVWLGAVVSIAAIAWFAIDAAGRQVIDDPVATRLTGVAATATTSAAPTTSSKPTNTARPSASSNSGANLSQIRPSAAPTSVSKELTITQENSLVSAESTYSTVAGRVRVRCDGARITLDGGYAQPATGWTVRVRDGGPDQVRVRFDRGREQTLFVLARCEDGRPAFDQRRFGDDHDRDRDDNRSAGSPVRSALKE